MATAALLDWYQQHARPLPWRRLPGQPFPTDANWPYRVWLAEVMLQQTTTQAVTPYFQRFLARWPSLSALAAAPDEEVMQAWAGLGYYARARNLLACARATVLRHGGQLPASEAELLALPGIGPYTAAAVAAFAFGQRSLIIDGNIERVITRLAAIDTPLPAARTEIARVLDRLTPAGEQAGDFAQALMDLARSLCTPRNPQCPNCPLAPQCAARHTDPQAFPVKPAKRPRPSRTGQAWWLEVQGHVLTIIRPPRGLLGGMRALPDSAEPPLPGPWHPRGAVSHGFTHFDLTLHVHALTLPARPDVPGDWLPLDQLPSAGFPTLFQKAITLALAQRAETA